MRSGIASIRQPLCALINQEQTMQISSVQIHKDEWQSLQCTIRGTDCRTGVSVFTIVVCNHCLRFNYRPVSSVDGEMVVLNVITKFVLVKAV